MLQTLRKLFKGSSRSRSTTSSTPSIFEQFATSYWAQPTDARDRAFFCKDTQLVDAEWDEIVAVLKQNFGNGPFTLLDVGCGAVSETREQLTACGLNVTVTGVDANPADDETLPVTAELLLPTLGSETKYDVVMCKRLLCNIPTAELQKSTVKQMAALTEEGGLTILCEPDDVPHRQVSEARVQGGLPALTRPAHNFPVRLPDMYELLPMGKTTLIAPDSYIWTRLTLPLMRQEEVPYDAYALRAAAPTYADNVRWHFGVHRLLISYA